MAPCGSAKLDEGARVIGVSKRALFQKIGYQPHAEQLLFHDSKARFRMSNCGRRFGKMLSLDTPLLTPAGWQTMASIRVGDSVYGPNGEANKVVAKSEVAYNETCYRVCFDDGTELIAHDLHQWAIKHIRCARVAVMVVGM